MSIEKFLPDEVVHGSVGKFLNRIKNSLVKKESPPVNKEFYNSDRSRRFEFYEWRGEDNFRQLNIRLSIKFGNGWTSTMAVMTRWSNSQEQLYGLELEALTQDSHWPWELFYYDHHTGGLKRKAGMWASSMDQSADEERTMAESLGFTYASKLPQFVDFEKTAKEFMLQAKKLDFSMPVIYPKELLK